MNPDQLALITVAMAGAMAGAGAAAALAAAGCAARVTPTTSTNAPRRTPILVTVCADTRGCSRYAATSRQQEAGAVLGEVG